MDFALIVVVVRFLRMVEIKINKQHIVNYKNLNLQNIIIMHSHLEILHVLYPQRHALSQSE